MKKLFLTLLSLINLNLPITAAQFPALTSLETALPTQTAPQEVDHPTNELMKAVGTHDIVSAKKALEQGARGEAITLLFPAHTGDTDMLKLLTEYRIGKKLSLDQQTEFGESAVYLACKYGHSEAAEFLLNAGANPFLTITITDFFHTKRDTALNIACKKHLASTVKLLLEKGGYRLINTTNEHGKSALHHLCEGEIDLALLKLFLENRGDANLQDNNGETPFHHACYPKKNKDTQIAALALLMQYGANTTILDKTGSSPKNRACGRGLLLDSTNLRVLDSFSDEALKIRAQETKAAAATATVAPTLKQCAIQILCSICMGDEEDKDDKKHIVIACNHGYHRACLTSWIARNPSCPLCRSTDITEKK